MKFKNKIPDVGENRVDVDVDGGEDGVESSKRPKKDNSNNAKNNQATFKVPAIPPGKSRSSSIAESDVFDAPMDLDNTSSTSDRESKNKMVHLLPLSLFSFIFRYIY